MLKEILARRRERAEKFKNAQEDMTISNTITQRTKTANERELERFQEEERQEMINSRLEQFRKRKREELWSGGR